MAFISLEFIVFFIIVSALFFLVPPRLKIPFLLLASLVFYGYSYPAYALLLLGAAALDYFIARGIEGSDSAATRRRLLLLSLVVNIGGLILFKYADFLNNSLAGLLNKLGATYQPASLAWPIPLGISFFTFTKIAYVVDVYRKKIPAETNPITFATFVAFFPNLISGPIERAGHLIPQLREVVHFDTRRTVEGLRLILWGVFKKVVIADRLAIYVNRAYGHPEVYPGAVQIIATVFFAFQIYADFSGYTDIARGFAAILGIDLFQNFEQPYLATSILDFWRRWHMTLTTWIREYLFFPLSRFLLRRTHRRYPRLVEVAAYLVTMSAVGLWHGASWTFVVWGLLHGVYMSIESVLNARRIRILPRNRAGEIASVLITFLLVSAAWVFFRLQSFEAIRAVFAHMFVPSSGSLFAPFAADDGIAPVIGLIRFLRLDAQLVQLALAFVLIGLLVAVDLVEASTGLNTLLDRMPPLVRWPAYYGLSFSVILLGAWGSQPFIYFKF